MTVQAAFLPQYASISLFIMMLRTGRAQASRRAGARSARLTSKTILKPSRGRPGFGSQVAAQNQQAQADVLTCEFIGLAWPIERRPAVAPSWWRVAVSLARSMAIAHAKRAAGALVVAACASSRAAPWRVLLPLAHCERQLSWWLPTGRPTTMGSSGPAGWLAGGYMAGRLARCWRGSQA